MTDTGKDAGLRAGDPAPGAVPDCDPPTASTTADACERAPDARKRGALSVQTRNRIAAQLRVMYDSVAQQPVPDRFADLIAKLDASDGRAPR